MAAAGCVDLVQSLEEALPLDVWEGFAHCAAHPIGAAEQASMRGVHELHDVVGTPHGDDEARRLLEGLEKALALGRRAPFSEHPPRGFRRDIEDGRN